VPNVMMLGAPSDVVPSGFAPTLTTGGIVQPIGSANTNTNTNASANANAIGGVQGYLTPWQAAVGAYYKTQCEQLQQLQQQGAPGAAIAATTLTGATSAANATLAGAAQPGAAFSAANITQAAAHLNAVSQSMWAARAAASASAVQHQHATTAGQPQVIHVPTLPATQNNAKATKSSQHRRPQPQQHNAKRHHPGSVAADVHLQAQAALAVANGLVAVNSSPDPNSATGHAGVVADPVASAGPASAQKKQQAQVTLSNETEDTNTAKDSVAGVSDGSGCGNVVGLGSGGFGSAVELSALPAAQLTAANSMSMLASSRENNNDKASTPSAEEEGMNAREVKKLRRKQSNRESARRSRLRKQVVCEELSLRVSQLSEENETLHSELHLTKQQCDQLTEENRRLQMQLLSLAGALHQHTPDQEQRNKHKQQQQQQLQQQQSPPRTSADGQHEEEIGGQVAVKEEHE